MVALDDIFVEFDGLRDQLVAQPAHPPQGFRSLSQSQCVPRTTQPTTQLYSSSSVWARVPSPDAANMDESSQRDIQRLIEMGFTPDQASVALLQANNNFEVALNSLVA